MKEDMDSDSSRGVGAQKSTVKCRKSNRERRLALLQDVDKLRKKLIHEENIHRALERAFTRPLGALPRLPPYLPPYILELLAEVAVLEEEVIRLEEQIVNFRQGLYQEDVYISSKKNTEITNDAIDNQMPCITKPKHGRSKSFSPNELNSPKPRLFKSFSTRKQVPNKPNPPLLLVDNGQGKENRLCTNSIKDKQSLDKRSTPKTATPMKRTLDKIINPQRSASFL